MKWLIHFHLHPPSVRFYQRTASPRHCISTEDDEGLRTSSSSPELSTVIFKSAIFMVEVQPHQARGVSMFPVRCFRARTPTQNHIKASNCHCSRWTIGVQKRPTVHNGQKRHLIWVPWAWLHLTLAWSNLFDTNIGGRAASSTGQPLWWDMLKVMTHWVVEGFQACNPWNIAQKRKMEGRSFLFLLLISDKMNTLDQTWTHS